MDTKIFIINGPNLNLLGRRENDIYGNRTLADIEILCKEKAESFPGASISFFQSNCQVPRKPSTARSYSIKNKTT